MAKLNERLNELLEQSVEDYIKTFVPISSGAVVKRLKSAKSPATVRNDLKTLEQMGYLRQVHTSGGRVPTTMGYRTYVNNIMETLRLKHGELGVAADLIGERVSNLPSMIDEICKGLSETFDLPIIVKHKFDGLVVQDIRVVGLIQGATLVLIKTNAGSITQTLQTDMPMPETACDDASAALMTACVGMTLGQMIADLPAIAAKLEKELEHFGLLVSKLSEKLEKVMTNTSRMNVIKLLDIPDYANVEKVKRLGRTIEDDRAVEQLLAGEDTVVIGAELSEDLDDASVIKFDYKIGDERVASVGILGPERMDYKSLITALYSLLATTVSNRQLTAGKEGKKSGK